MRGTEENAAPGQPSSSGRPFEEALDPAAVVGEGPFQSEKGGSPVSSRTRLSQYQLGKGALLDGPSETHQLLSNEDPDGKLAIANCLDQCHSRLMPAQEMSDNLTA